MIAYHGGCVGVGGGGGVGVNNKNNRSNNNNNNNNNNNVNYLKNSRQKIEILKIPVTKHFDLNVSSLSQVPLSSMSLC